MNETMTSKVIRHPAIDKEIGEGFTIRRALPNPERRTVGAWCFLDHAGPVDYRAGQGLHVGPHPHIGLQTFTWMIEGEVMHRDSLGYEQIIRPGQVNLMTAGRGIAHAEDAASEAAGRLHAAQLWIALPDSQRHCAPTFDHYPQLPTLKRGGFRITVLAGELLGQRAPTRVYTPLLGLDLCCDGDADVELPLATDFEHAAMVLRGSLQIEDVHAEPGALYDLGRGRSRLHLRGDGPAQLLLIGGAPFAEDLLMWWNFVARTPEELAEAVDDWNAGRRFGTVHGSPSAPLIAPDLSGLNLRSPTR